MSRSVRHSVASSGTGSWHDMMLLDVAAIGSIERPRF
jgi:hypothetical protein